MKLETNEYLTRRMQFVRDYCRQRGWPEELHQLNWEQIAEIREQDGWKEPSVSVLVELAPTQGDVA